MRWANGVQKPGFVRQPRFPLDTAQENFFLPSTNTYICCWDKSTVALSVAAEALKTAIALKTGAIYDNTGTEMDDARLTRHVLNRIAIFGKKLHLIVSKSLLKLLNKRMCGRLGARSVCYWCEGLTRLKSQFDLVVYSSEHNGRGY